MPAPRLQPCASPRALPTAKRRFRGQFPRSRYRTRGAQRACVCAETRADGGALVAVPQARRRRLQRARAARRAAEGPYQAAHKKGSFAPLHDLLVGTLLGSLHIIVIAL